MEKKKNKIVAHSGGYHADDVFACATLSLLMKKRGEDFEIIRTRDQAVIETADYVVDVGGEFNPNKNRFDHHQIGGAGLRLNGIPYASFGLVWNAFGEEISGSAYVKEQIDKKVAMPIDAIDSGVELSRPTMEGVYEYSINAILSAFEPTWNENKDTTDQAFLKMVSFASELLEREMIKAKADEEADKIIMEAYKKSDDKRLVILEQSFSRQDINRTLSLCQEVLFYITPKTEGNSWSFGSVLSNANSFTYRKLLPEAWAGLKDDTLAQITGVADAMFCHKARFLCGAKSKEGALKLAELALNSN